METERLAKRRRLHEPTANDRHWPVPQASSSWQEHQHGSNHFRGTGLQHQNGHIHINRDLIIGNSATLNDIYDRKSLLESLEFDQIDSRRASIKNAFPNTCRWLLQTPVYKQWEDQDPSQDENHFLWIKGKPGSGKSTLMKFLYQHLQPKSKKANNVLISFFFNARGHALEKSTEGLFRSLLVQLLQKQPDLLDTLDIPRRDCDWDLYSLESLFEQAIQNLKRTPVVCLVDALDECDEREFRGIVHFFADLVRTEARLSICFASRHYPHISIITGLSIVLENQDKHEEDIATYLGKALRIGHDNLAREIRLDLQEKASGVFMWVVLVVDILNKEFDAGRKHTLEEKVKQLPANLHELFRDILTRDTNGQGALLLCIQWVLFAKRPLTPRELYFAILSGYEPEDLEICHTGIISDEDIYKYILNNSKGVVESTKGKTSTIQFINESVRDFLLKQGGLGQMFADLATNVHGKSHDALKRCCIAYMNAGTKVEAKLQLPTIEAELQLPTIEATKVQRPFLEYAVYGILYHAEQAENHNVSQSEFLAEFPRQEWIRDHNSLEKHKSRHYTPSASVSYILAESDTPALICAHASRRSFFDVEGERYGIPILAAMATKSSAAAQAMLKIEAEKSAKVSWPDFQSLIPSSYDGFFNTSTRNFNFNRNREMIAELLTHTCEALLLFLLLTGDADIKSKDVSGRTLLDIAASEGYGVLLNELLKIDNGILTADRLNQLLFHARNGAAAKMLLERGADPMVVNTEGRTPLHELIANVRRRRRLEIIKILIKTKAVLSATDNDGETPLHRACILNDARTALSLIEHGADVVIMDKERKTPLHYASQHEAPKIVKKLIEHGADLSVMDQEGKTPLHYASRYGGPKVVKQLIDYGANDSIMDKKGRTPFHYAPISSNLEHVAAPLHEHGADIIPVDKNGKTSMDQSLLHFNVKRAEQSSTFIKAEEDPHVTQAHTDFAYESHGKDQFTPQYPYESFLPPQFRPEFIAKFANNISIEIGSALLSEVHVRKRLIEALPNLLEAFSLKVGRDATRETVIEPSTSVQGPRRDIMYLVHEYRHQIADEFASCISRQPGPKDRDMPYQEYHYAWSQNDQNYLPASDISKKSTSPSGEKSYNVSEHKQDLEVVKKEEGLNHQVEFYAAEVLKMEAYKWLLQCLKREIILSPAEPNILESIRRDIVEYLSSNSKVHQRAPSHVHDVTFEVNWDVTLFLKQQNYGCQPSEALPTVITLTGTPSDAMATTVYRYMMQTWPMTGEVTLKLIQDILGQDWDRQYYATFFDGTELRAFTHVEESKPLEIAVTGTVTSIAEVAEQLAWLGSAVRSSSQESGMESCIPRIRPKSAATNSTRLYELDFSTYKVEDTQESDGKCWHDLFSNPVLVTGFPIPRRDESNTGIEMSLALMASLVGSHKIDYFRGKALIKGFSALLIPKHWSNNTLIWHLSVNKSGNCIPYPIESTYDVIGITYDAMKDLRHIVGWCGSAQFNAGLREAFYAVQESTFPDLPNIYAAAEASISHGEDIKDSSDFRLGIKDISIHQKRNTYFQKLDWISQQLVVLWDQEDKRGWLVNGASALLHLVRASLRCEGENSRTRRRLHFDDEKIREEEFYSEGANVAYHVLISEENRTISLYSGRDECLLEDRILQHYEVLAQAFDLQAELSQCDTGQASSQSTKQPSQSWAAWDFAGLAKYSGPFSPKLATIQAGHLDWLDFLRDNLGITLIGNGFGEIIKPDSDSLCKYWSQLPKEKHYLAASRLDIKMVTDRHPERKYVFKDAGGNLVSCRCPDGGGHDSLNPLQPHPSPHSPHSPESPTTKSGLEKLRGDGAIIFDQSTILVSGKDTAPQVGTWNKSNSGHAATSNRKRKANRKDPCQRELQHSAKKRNLHTLRHSDYRVAIICPLVVEMTAVRYMFDEEVERQSSNAFQTPDDPNDYILGKVGGHHVVLTWLRGKRQGKSAAAGVASDLQRTFRHVQWCFLVGIGGGNPSSKHDIHLGDVVVAEPDKSHCGVVQYDLGKDTDNGFELKGSLGPPPDKVLNALFRMQADHFIQKGNKIDEIVGTMIAKDTEGLAQYMRPDPEMDVLFDHGSKHEPGQDTCLSCDLKQIVTRPHRTQSKIHYGLIASGDSVMRSAERRGIQSRNAGSDVLCFEMEAAGVLTVLPCTVIRGISDYADSHKNDKWHAYAAAAAAAFTRMLLIDYLIP